MSLINQMLRDLEARRAAPAPPGASPLLLATARTADAAVAATAPADNNAGGVQYWLMAMVALLAVLLGLLLWSSSPPWQGGAPAGTSPGGNVVSEPVARVPVVEMTVQPALPEAVEPLSAGESGPAETAGAGEPGVVTPPAVAAAPARPAPVIEAEAATSPVVAEKTRPESSTAEPTPRPQSSAPSPQPLPPAVVNKRIRPLNNEQRAEQALRRGVGLLGEGRQAEAESALREALRFEPRQLRARETLAALYLNSGRLSEAQALLAEGLRLSPRAAALAQLHARLLADQGELATALTVLQRASPPPAENPDYHALLAALYQRAGQHASAAWVYRQLLARRGTQATWWLGLGISLEALDDAVPALDAYLKAHQLGAGLDPQVLAYLGDRIAALTPRVAAIRQAADTAKAEE